MEHSYFTTSSSKNQPLSRCERLEIKRALSAGFSIRSIAKSLGRAPSTISRDVKRGSRIHRERTKYISKDPNYPEFIDLLVYYPDVAANVVKSNCSNRGGNFKLNDPTLINFVEKCIIEFKYSPDVVVNLLQSKFNFKICTKTIYNYIEKQVVLKVKSIDLLNKVKLKKKEKNITKKRKRIFGTSIELRPDSINNRSEFGHYEGDCIVGKDHKSVLLTLNERKTNKYIIRRIKAKNSRNVVRQIHKILKENNLHIKSITFDNGSEFAGCMQLEKYNIKVYYAHPYSAYERGANENLNGMARRFFPKGTDFNKVSNEKIQWVENWINNYPRKKFKYLTANEMFAYEIEKATHCA